jgi:hypothetical protein
MSLSTNANLPPVYIRTRIPKTYERQPIISRLISRYGLTVNIAAALLGNYDRNYGWFDLELQGSAQKVEAALAYLQGLNIEIFQLTLKSLLEARIKKSQRLGITNDEIDVPIEQLHTITEDEPENDLIVEEGQTTQTKIQVCIPKHYRAQPVISGLVSRYRLTTNITSALLSADAEDDGWFDLELWGRRRQILLGLRYLEQLGLQAWF